MNITDIILIVFLGLGLIMGLFRNWWRLFIGCAVLGISLLIFIKGGPLDYISNWIRYDSINFLVQQNWIQPIEIDLQEQLGVTFKIETVQEAFILLQNFDISADLIVQNTDLFCKSIALTLGIIVLAVASFIVSSILYWALLRWIMPKFLRKGWLGHGLGGLVGTLSYGVFGVIFISTIYSFLEGINGNVIVPLMDTNSALYGAVLNFVGPEQIDSIIGPIQNIAGFTLKFNPFDEGSVLCRPLLSGLDSMGLSPFNMISTTSIITGEEVNFKDAFNNFLKDVTNKFIEKSSSFAGV